MSKIFATVADIDKNVFDAACTVKLNAGYTPVGGVSKYGENARQFIQGFQKDTATNTPLITISNGQIVLDFGNVAAGASGAAEDLRIQASYITGNIIPTLTGLNSALFTLADGGASILPDGDGNIDVTKAVNFAPPALTATGEKEAYIQLVTDGGQKVNVIVKGTVI